MRAWVVFVAIVLGCMGTGCGTLMGAALGQVLCSAGDAGCRSTLIEQGFAQDTGTVSVGGRSYAAASVFDCQTSDGRHMVIQGTGEYVSYTCLGSGASSCTCVSFGRHRL